VAYFHEMEKQQQLVYGIMSVILVQEVVSTVSRIE